MNNRIYINDGWKFSEKYIPEMLAVSFDDSDMTDVRLPHTCKETPYHYFDEEIYQMVCAYRKKLSVPASWKEKCVLLTMEGAAHDSEVFLNGEKVGEHHCGYTAFSVDLTTHLRYGEENILTVKVDSRETLNIPPFGFVIDYMTYGGLYRDVYLEVKNENYLEDVFLHSKIGWKISGDAAAQSRSDEKPAVALRSQITLRYPEENLRLCQYIREKGSDSWRMVGTYHIKNKEKEIRLQRTVSDVRLWSVEDPVLYEVKTELLRDNRLLDENITVFGFRKAEFQKDGFYLNGQKVKIRGLNRHQSYPYVGYAMPESMQKMDADILKDELGLNAVRTSHYPQSHYFLDRCDEKGLLVFTEIPGWQHIGDDDWKAQAVRNVEDMVKQYRNHPSIVLWGVRINESKDDDEFYKMTNLAAKKMDPYRQTGGVRAMKKSSLLEDVYTYNDFSHDGKAAGCEPKKNITPDMEKSYMITEYNGHMYPTKSFDSEEHRTEHALRHGRVLNAAAGEEDIAGSFGWCMADYNTHRDFGSGDRICYHGVLDMFRNPKLAAEIYACQQEEKPVLSVSSSMDIGEHPASSRGKNWIFSNGDSVRMYKNSRLIKEYHPWDSEFKNLKHGPILIDDYIGSAVMEIEDFDEKQAQEITEALNLAALHGIDNLPKKVYVTMAKLMLMKRMKYDRIAELYTKYVGDWGGEATVYRFDAVKNGAVVQSVIKCPMKTPQLWAEADHTTLVETHSYDVAAIRMRMQDENGNLLNYCNEPVVIEVKGPAELIGPRVISLKGGMGGTYLKTTGQEGTVTLVLKNSQCHDVVLEFSVNVKKEYTDLQKNL